MAERLRGKVAEFGGGPYGVGALGWLAVLESLDVYAWWLEARPVGPLVDRVLSGTFGFELLFGGLWRVTGVGRSWTS